jgi:serine protease Do
MKSNRIRLLPWAGVLAIGVAVGMIVTSNLGLTPKGMADKGAGPVVLGSQSAPSQELLSAQGTSQAFTVISKEMLPAVVSVATSKTVKRSQEEDEFFNNPFFRDFFGRGNPLRQPQNQKMEGLGSGVIVSKEGYILTNNHVVEQADDIKVTLYDHRQFEAKLVGKDPLTEVAVIKIDATNLPVARLGNSDELEIGEWVLAFGNPLGLNSTVTAGIVSAKGRSVGIIQDKDSEKASGSYAIENFIQTDAAINPGNSGGPLVNLKGQVIGINTAIATGTGYYAGYGFAIPVNLASKIMNDLISKGYVTRAWLGIAMKPVDENIAERYNLERPKGILVEQVVDDSPAQKAGLKVLDVILKVDGKEVDQSNEVQNYIALKNPGEVVTLSILRDGAKISVPVKLGHRDTGRTGAGEGETEGEGEIKLGLTVQNITDNASRQFNIDRGQEGVVITGVDETGAAAGARIQPGDVLVKIEEKPVKSVAEYRKILRSFQKGKVVIFTLVRDGNTFHAFVKLPK